MSARHQISTEALSSLGSGRGDQAALTALRASQFSEHLLLVRMIMDAVPAADRRSSGLDAAYRLLERAQAHDPHRTADLIMHPQVGTWATHCLRVLRQETSTTVPDADLGYFNGLAAVAAASAGLEFRLQVPVRDGVVALPGLGSAWVGPEVAVATVRADENGLAIVASAVTITVPADPGRTVPGWHGVRRLRADTGFGVLLDDIDPFRTYQGLPLRGRLSDQEAEQWRRTFRDAWRLLRRHHTEHAEAMARTVRSLVPIDGRGRQRSATCSESFGAIAMSLPPDAPTCAAALVHEFQHTKLGALLDLLALCDSTSDVAFYAPWREDPRPPTALLHGIYAHLGVAMFWRTHRHVADAVAKPRAEFEFAYWREQTGFALRLLRGSGALTAHGEHFAAAIAAALADMAAEVVPDEAANAAADVAIAHRVRWRLTHVSPSTAELEPKLRAWRAGRPCPPVRATDRTNAVRRGESRSVPAAGSCGHALARTALESHRRELAADPHTVQAWAGLALAARRLHEHQAAATALIGLPEVAAALNRRISGEDQSIDPVDLAAWLGPAVPDDDMAGFVATSVVSQGDPHAARRAGDGERTGARR